MTNKHLSEILIFLHIAKSGGSTLRSIINRAYPSESIIITIPPYDRNIQKILDKVDFQKKELQVIQGHMGFGSHEWVPQQAKYITLLRDPIDRVLSHYFYDLGKRHRDIFPNGPSSKPMGLDEYVTSGIRLFTDNGATRLLSSTGGMVYKNQTKYGTCTQEMLEIAKENINKYFLLVGLTEYFDETIILLQKELGWMFPFYRRRRVTSKRLPIDKIDVGTRKLIEHYNEFDLELYQFAKELFLAKIIEHRFAFKTRLITFKIVNQIVGMAYKKYKLISRKRIR